MKAKKIIPALMALAALVGSCGQKMSVAKLASSPSGEDLPLSSIGRGAKLVLTKDIEVPANSMGVTLDAREVTYRVDTDDTNFLRKSYMRCGIEMKSQSLDRRVLKTGTVIEFSGEVGSHPSDNSNRYQTVDLFVASPGDVSGMVCMNLITRCWLGLCDPYTQVEFKIRDFKNYMSGTATVEQAQPVIVNNN